MDALTEDEKRRLFGTLDAVVEQNKAQSRELADLKVQVQAINRAMYGDEINKVKGFIDRVAAIEEWITAKKIKLTYVGIAGSVLGGIIHYLYNFFTDGKPPIK